MYIIPGCQHEGLKGNELRNNIGSIRKRISKSHSEEERWGNIAERVGGR